jgi:hypothetical protein
VGTWYWIGVFGGIGVSFGVLFAGVLAPSRVRAAAIVLAPLAGGLLGFALGDWEEIVAGAVGGALGSLAALELARGALRRGGTRGGTGVLLALSAAGLAALAFVPALGYVTAVALPALAARLRLRAPKRYAGLRTLARD